MSDIKFVCITFMVCIALMLIVFAVIIKHFFDNLKEFESFYEAYAGVLKKLLENFSELNAQYLGLKNDLKKVMSMMKPPPSNDIFK